MELAEVLVDVATDVAGRTELEIRQLEELEAFDSLRLPVEDAAEAAAEVAAEILAEVLVELAGETELARTKLARTKLARTKLARTELV